MIAIKSAKFSKSLMNRIVNFTKNVMIMMHLYQGWQVDKEQGRAISICRLSNPGDVSMNQDRSRVQVPDADGSRTKVTNQNVPNTSGILASD